MSLRVLWALEELRAAHNLQYRLKIYPRSIRSQGTKEVHPLGKSPVLCIGPKPEQALTEARLVLQYLSDTYSKALWEPDEEDKARDVFFQEFANVSLLVKVSRSVDEWVGGLMGFLCGSRPRGCTSRSFN